MSPRTIRSIDPLLIAWLTLVAAALVVAPVRVRDVLPGFPLTASIDPFEEDDLPSEDPLELGVVPQSVRSRGDAFSLGDGGKRQVPGTESDRLVRRWQRFPAGTSGGLFERRNGCGADLRC